MLIDSEDQPAESFTASDDRIPIRFSTISEALKYQWNSPKRRKFLLCKIPFVVIFLVILIINAITPITHGVRPTDCLIDYFQNWTGSINQYLANNETLKDILIAISSFLIDFLVAALSLRWVYYSQNLRPLFAGLIFFGFRTLTQKIFYLGYPEGYIFEYPGFPSLVVPYGRSNDFFFSGHLGITTICFLQFYHDKAKFLYMTALIILPFEFFMLLVTRKHHFIDLTCGIIFAHSMFRLSFWFEEVVINILNYFKRDKEKHL